MTEGKAVSPKDFTKLLKEFVNVKEDGSFFYKSGEKETSIADGVKDWLAANKWAVKNEVAKGASSGNTGANGGKKFTMADLKGMSREEINSNWNEIQKGVDE